MTPHRQNLMDVWSTEAWRTEVTTWVEGRMTESGRVFTGVVEQPRIRPWSTLLTTVAADGGRVWFKENHPAQSAEAAVVAEIARLDPDHVVTPIAVEPDRGWLLSPDHGQTLYDAGGSGDERLWARVVREFAELQRQIAGETDAFQAAGLVTLRPGAVASYVETRVRELHERDPADHMYVDGALFDRAMASVPRLQTIGEVLDQATPGLLSLEHNDLHANNAFLPWADESTLRFFDFADAIWAHPFTSLNIPIGVMCRTLETTEEDPRVGYVIDAYLEPWTHLGSRAELRRLVRVARLLSRVHRFESWRRLLDGMPGPIPPDFADAAQHWLGEVADISSP